MSANTIVILATLDTKGHEAQYLREQIEKLGEKALVVDVGVVGTSAAKADISREEVAEAGGTSLVELNRSLSALNSTVTRLETGLDHLDGTLSSLDDLAKRLLAVLQPVEAILERMDNIVSLGETMMMPLNATEHVMRGVMDRLRNRGVR